MRKTGARAALIGVMLSGGLLYAGISQAQDAGVQAERTAELVAATGGPAAPDHLIPFEADKAAVDVRDDDVAPVQAQGDVKADATGAETPQPTPVSVSLTAPEHR